MQDLIRPTVIFDIDGTLARLTPEREAMLRERRFSEYFKELGTEHRDVEMCYLLIALYKAQSRIVISTGRPELYRARTSAWLDSYNIPYSALFMRNSTTERDHEVKRSHIKEMKAAGYNIVAMFDDRPSVIQMAREEGILALHCAEGY